MSATESNPGPSMDEDERLARQLQEMEVEEQIRNANERAAEDERSAKLIEELQQQEAQAAQQARAQRQASQSQALSRQNSRQVGLEVGRGTLVRLFNVKTGNYIQEVLYVTNLANRQVVFDLESRRGVKLSISDDGRVGFEYDNTDRSLFICDVVDSAGNVYLQSVAHRYQWNNFGGRGWYLSMARDGTLLGDSGRTEYSVWALVDAGVPVPTGMTAPPGSRQGSGVNQGPAASQAVGQESLPVPPMGAQAATARTPAATEQRTPVSKYNFEENPIVIWLQSVDGQAHLKSNPSLMGMYSNTHIAVHDSTRQVNFNHALHNYVIYRPDNWEECAIRVYNYYDRQDRFFPADYRAPTADSNGSSVATRQRTEAPKSRGDYSSLGTHDESEATAWTDSGGMQLHTGEFGGSQSPAFESYYATQREHQLSHWQVDEFKEKGYLVLPGLANRNSNSGNLVENALRLLRYFEGFHQQRSLSLDHYELLCPSSTRAGDADILSLYYDTPLFAICYQLLQKLQYTPPPANSENAVSTRASLPPGPPNEGYDMVEMTEYTSGSINPLVSSANSNPDSVCGPGENPHKVLRQYIFDSGVIACYPSISPATSAPIAADDSFARGSTHVSDVQVSSLIEEKRWRVHKGDKHPDRSVQTTGLRLLIALTDTSVNGPGSDSGTMHSVGNVCVHEKSHMNLLRKLNPQADNTKPLVFPKNDYDCFSESSPTKPPLRDLKQLHLRPGDVVLCDENLAVRSEGMPNYGLNTQYLISMLVCHQYRADNSRHV